jgi:hypothetical protein
LYVQNVHSKHPWQPEWRPRPLPYGLPWTRGEGEGRGGGKKEKKEKKRRNCATILLDLVARYESKSIQILLI